MENLSILRQEFISGNNSKLKELYNDYRDDVMNVVISKNICPATEVESLFSESLLVFYEKVVTEKLMEVKSIKNYLVGICINTIRNEKKAQFRMDKKVDEVRLLLYDNDYYDMKANTKEDLRNMCYKALNSLNEKCKEIIIAYYLDRMSMKEIATTMNLSSGDVAKTLKSRCFKTLLNATKKEYNASLI